MSAPALFLAVVAALLSGGVDPPSGEAILRRVDENLGSDNKVTRARMTVRGRGGSRTVEMQSWIRGMSESFTEYVAPPRDRGTKMLKLDDQLWTYFPATDRTVAISGHMLRQSVMGSDLSYEDLMEDPRLSQIYDATVEGQDELRGRRCWVLALTAKGPGLAYHTRQVWVDQERLVVLRENRYARGGRLLKTTDVEEVERSDGRWIAKTVLFKDALKGGEGTTFELQSIEFDAAIPEHVFSKASLRR